MEIIIVPTAVGALVIDDKTRASFPCSEDIGATMGFSQGHNYIEEAHRMAGGIEICPAKIDPATIWLLGIEKIVDSSSHRTADSLVAQEAIPADEHESAKSRNPYRALPVGREGAPSPIFPLAIDKGQIISQEVRGGARMQQYTQRMGDEF